MSLYDCLLWQGVGIDLFQLSKKSKEGLILGMLAQGCRAEKVVKQSDFDILNI